MSYFENNVRYKKKYENLSIADNDSKFLKSLIGSIIIGLFLMLLLIILWNVGRNQPYHQTYIVIINTHSQLLHNTSDRFLSFGLDSSLLRDMKNFPIKNDTFINLARHLGPAYVRVGGTSADCLQFNFTLPISATQLLKSPIDDQDISNFTLTEDDYLAIYEFTKKADIRMMFDLNVLYRTGNYWNDSNARQIINYSKARDMIVDWQLGNEPNSFKHVFNRSVSGKQLGQDYYHLRLLLTELGYDESVLVGPEANHIGDDNMRGDKYITEFLKNDGNSVNFVTWHQYYLNGHTAQLEDFIKPDVFNQLPVQITRVQNATKLAGRNISMWISETSSAYGGGAKNLSDRFVAGFLWLDKLGYSASTGVNIVIRQSLFGGNYAMVGPDLIPNPDWWVSVFFKQLVSTKVIKLMFPNNFGHVRLYAHCTPESALLSRVPAVTVYGINLNNNNIKLLLKGNYSRRGTKVFLYILTSDHLQSRNIMLNGEILKLRADGSLPAFKPIIVDSKNSIVLPPYSMAFMVIHGVNVSACTA